MNSQQSPVLRLLVGGFAIGALGHLQGPVAMAADLLAGGPGATRDLNPSREEAMAPRAVGAVLSAPVDEQATESDKPVIAMDVESPSTPDIATFGSSQSIDHLRTLVTAVEPEQAAAILEAIPVEDAAKVVTGLPVSTAVAMLSAMTAEGSAQLTEELAKTPSDG